MRVNDYSLCRRDDAEGLVLQYTQLMRIYFRILPLLSLILSATTLRMFNLK